MMARKLYSKSCSLLILHTVLCWNAVVSDEALFSDNNGHCSATTPFRLRSKDDHFQVRSLTLGNDFETLDCRLPFKAQGGDGICFTFDEFFIDDCGVSLLIYKGFLLHTEHLWKKLVCHDQNPGTICTSERDATLRILKDNYNKNTGYGFNIIIGEKSPSVATASGSLFDETGFVILFIIAVIFVLTVLALFIFCCRCTSPAAIATAFPKKTKPHYESCTMPSADRAWE